MCISILGACVVAAIVTNAGTFENGMADTAHSYDGVARDVSKFYKDEQINWYGTGRLYLDNDLRIDVGYNSGIDTAKLDVSKSYTLGMQKLIDIDETSSLIIGGSYTYGGKVRHESCKDSYGREYYCGNLTAYSDFKPQEHKAPMSASVKYIYRF